MNGKWQHANLSLCPKLLDHGMGRKPALNAEQVVDLQAKAATGAKKTALAKEFGISRETLYQYLRQADRASTGERPALVRPGSR